jgi:hypothetical protein
VGASVVLGCSKSDDSTIPPEKAELAQIYEIYKLYIKKNQAPPKQFSDLNQKAYSEVSPLAFNGIKDGKYVVVWNVSDQSSGTVLAYEKDAPEKGGNVLMADGTVKTMNADDLKAAIKK